MTEQALDGDYEGALHGERYFQTMEEAIEFTRWLSVNSLAINPVNTEVGQLYQLVYQWKEGAR